VQPVSLALQQHVCKTDCKTKDSVMVKVMTAVQYKIERDMVKAAVFHIEQPLRQIEAEVDSILRSTVPSMTLDESYEAKDKMVEEILSSVKEAMKRYGYDIIKVLITDIKPEASILAAMNKINAQRRQRAAALEKGEAEKFLKIKASEAEAEAKRLAGVGMAGMRTAMAYGYLDSIQFMTNSGMTEAEALQMMLMTQYLDTLKDFSRRHSSILVPQRPFAAKNLKELEMQSEASLPAAPQFVFELDEMEEKDATEMTVKAGKGKIIKKKRKKVVKSGSAFCDCDGDVGENQV